MQGGQVVQRHPFTAFRTLFLESLARLDQQDISIQKGIDICSQRVKRRHDDAFDNLLLFFVKRLL